VILGAGKGGGMEKGIGGWQKREKGGRFSGRACPAIAFVNAFFDHSPEAAALLRKEKGKIIWASASGRKEEAGKKRTMA